MRFKPRVDALYLWVAIPTTLLIVAMLVFSCVFFSLGALLISVFTLVFTGYFLFAPIWLGYAELREDGIFIDFGIFIKRTIPYSKIRKIERKRKWYSESMLSLKCAMEHLDIKYNRFDVVSVSLCNEDDFLEELNEKIKLNNP